MHEGILTDAAGYPLLLNHEVNCPDVTAVLITFVRAAPLVLAAAKEYKIATDSCLEAMAL